MTSVASLSFSPMATTSDTPWAMSTGIARVLLQLFFSQQLSEVSSLCENVVIVQAAQVRRTPRLAAVPLNHANFLCERDLFKVLETPQITDSAKE